MFFKKRLFVGFLAVFAFLGILSISGIKNTSFVEETTAAETRTYAYTWMTDFGAGHWDQGEWARNTDRFVINEANKCASINTEYNALWYSAYYFQHSCVLDFDITVTNQQSKPFYIQLRSPQRVSTDALLTSTDKTVGASYLSLDNTGWHFYQGGSAHVDYTSGYYNCFSTSNIDVRFHVRLEIGFSGLIALITREGNTFESDGNMFNLFGDWKPFDPYIAEDAHFYIGMGVVDTTSTQAGSAFKLQNFRVTNTYSVNKTPVSSGTSTNSRIAILYSGNSSYSTPYTGSNITPSFTLYYNGIALPDISPDSWYSKKYSNNKDCSSNAQAIAELETKAGTGYLEGTKISNFTIIKASYTPEVTEPTNPVFDGVTSHEISNVTLNGVPQTGKYTITYKRDGVVTNDLISAGDISYTVTCQNSTQTKSGSYTIQKLDLWDCDITFEFDMQDNEVNTYDYRYDGNSHKRGYDIFYNGYSVKQYFAHVYVTQTDIGTDSSCIEAERYNLGLYVNNSSNVSITGFTMPNSWNYFDDSGRGAYHFFTIDGQVLDFIDDPDYLGMGLNTPGRCISCYSQTKEKLLNDDTPDSYLYDEFTTNNDRRIGEARERYEAWARNQHDDSPYREGSELNFSRSLSNSKYNKVEDDNNLILILTLSASSIILICSFGVLVYYKKKK